MNATLKRLTLALVAGFLTILCSQAWAGPVLQGVQERGHVRCGVSSGVAGFSAPNSNGEYQGLDVDICRAVAAAVLGDANAVQYTPLSSQQRFAALQADQIDLLSRNTTWTLSRDAGLGILFAAITYYDGQGILVPARFGLTSATELDGAEICVQSGTTNEKNLATFMKRNGIAAKPIVYDQFEAAYKAFFKGRCQGFSTDVSALVGLKTKQALNPEDYVVLPEVFSKEPLGPSVPDHDVAWLNVVKWTVFGMIEAEELGVSQANLQEALSGNDPALLRLLGQAENLGKPLGLPSDWMQKVISQVGNYGEVFERHLGKNSPLKLPRGLNRLWTEGGLMYAPPLR
ncbi:MAG: amino acid ABC transporter substrate-binding protein [Limnobacter sp.]|nr:amino acid ABC transporter substrate-binding protein [Limnobacter sp.]